MGPDTTARHAHATPTRPGRTPRFPSSTAPTSAPPRHQQCHPDTNLPHPPPTGTRPLGHHAKTPTKPPPPPAPANTHHRESPLPRPPRETPSPDPAWDNDGHPSEPTPPPSPHPAHLPPHRPDPTPYTTPQRYGSRSGPSETKRRYASTPSAPPSASGRPALSRRPPWGRASETSSSMPSSTSPDACVAGQRGKNKRERREKRTKRKNKHRNHFY